MSSYLANYLVFGTQDCIHHEPLTLLEQALQAGITCVQLREKGPKSLQENKRIEFAKECQALCQQYQVPFFVNDDLALAIAVNADGIHVGQEDISVEQIRKHAPKLLIGLSVHTKAQVERAIKQKVDYVGIGPIYETTTKKDGIQSSPDFLKEICQQYSQLPVVAIGGIDGENQRALRQMGASGIAVVSAITKQYDIVSAVNQIKE